MARPRFGVGLATWVARAAVSLALLPSPAAALDPFEIQVYDGTSHAPRHGGLELHSNVVTSGETHLTLEPALGLLPFWEIGAYLQTAINTSGGYDYAGGKLRSKFVTPRGWRPHLRLGLNIEVAWIPPAYDPDRYGSELRPIVAWENDDWLLAANPNLDFTLTSAALGAGPSFEPAVTVKRRVGTAPVALGLEYYASFGPVSAPLAWARQDHLFFQTIDATWGRFDFNLGIGERLTGAGETLVIKLISAYAY